MPQEVGIAFACSLSLSSADNFKLTVISHFQGRIFISGA
jgi:hypothetical protein